MTIIDYMRQKLMEYPKISEILAGDDIHVDFTEPGTGYGLSSVGDSLVNENIWGNQIRSHSFTLYAVAPSFTDYCRLANSNFLLELSYWLERLPAEGDLEMEVGGQKLKGRFLGATTANAMAMQPIGKTINGDILYQLQIQATYELESEEI